MTLPNLPKKHKNDERDLDRLVAERVRKVHKEKNWLLEVKMEGGRMKRHQTVAQKQVENGTFLYKPPDNGSKNPADYICLGDADAIVCIVAKNHKDVACKVNGTNQFTIRI